MAKVLLVEDDNNLREIYQTRLSAEGYDIIAAQNGEEALVIAKQHHPDLIISDVMMPRISGFEMLDILRNTDELRDTKVIMLTALGQAEDQARAGKLGADKYLVKSQVTLEDIVNCAKDLLDGNTAPVLPQPVAATAAATQPTAPKATPPAETVLANAVPVAPVNDPAPIATLPVDSTAAATATSQPQVPAPNTPVPVPSPAPAPGSMPDETAQSVPSHPMFSASPPIVPVVDPDPIAQVANPTPSPVTPQPSDSSTTATLPTAQDTQSLPPALATTAVSEAVVSQPSQPPIATDLNTTSPESNLVNTETTTNQEVPAPVVLPEAEVAAADPQSLASEEAAIEKQIENFATSSVPSREMLQQPPAQDTANSNEEALRSAVDELTAAVNEPAPALLPPSQKPIPGDAEAPSSAEPVTTPVPTETNPLPAPAPQTEANPSQAPAATPNPVAATTTAAPSQVEPTPAAVPAPPVVNENDVDQVNVAGKKVIQPINDISHGPNLDELLAKEAAREAGGSVEAPATPVAVVEQPAAQTGDDPNSIAL